MSGYVNSDGASNTYETLNSYVNGIKEIINSSGLFKTKYDDVAKQVDLMNDMIEQFNTAIIPSLKHDLLDIMNETTNWDELKTNLSKDIKIKQKTSLSELSSKLIPFKFNVSKVDKLSDDILTNMNMVFTEIEINNDNIEMSAKQHKKEIMQFNAYRNEFKQDLDEFLSNISNCENIAVNCRNNNVDIMKKNIDILYKIHVNYAHSLIHNKKNKANIKNNNKDVNNTTDNNVNTDTINYKDAKGKIIEIPLCKSQHEFITKAIKKMLAI